VDAHPFQRFDLAHNAVVALTAAAALALVCGGRKIRRLTDDRAIRYPAALLLGLTGGAAWIRNYSDALIVFPFHLCDLALVAMVWALVQPTQRLVCELAFFWALAASSQAILTPDLAHGFPSFRWISFFLVHGGVIVGAVYVTARGYLVPRVTSIVRAWLGTNVYAVVAGLLNWRFGTNFGFLARKPVNPSLLDYLGPWPYYILACEAIALILFFLCYVFARWVDARARNSA
jgi:hypothetical integral membrane protein (TIGR02206 family)